MSFQLDLSNAKIKRAEPHITKGCSLSVPDAVTFQRRGCRLMCVMDPQPPIQMSKIYNNILTIPIEASKILNVWVSPTPDILDSIPDTRTSLLSRQIIPFEKAFNFIKDTNSCILNFPPGFGKTIMSLNLWLKSKHPLLIYINRESLETQWIASIELCIGKEYADANLWVVGSNKAPYKNNKNNANIILCMSLRSGKIPEDVRRRVGYVIVDEAHLFCTRSNVSALLSVQPKYIIFCSATLQRSDEMEKIVHSICNKTSKVDVISRKPFIFHAIHTGFHSICSQSSPTYGDVCKSLFANKRRNDMIMNLIYKANVVGRKVMVLSTMTAHLDEIHKLGNEQDRFKECTFEKFYGLKKGCDNYDVLLGTFGKVGTGFDEATSCSNFDGIKSSVLIVCITMKKLSLAIQLFGRCMRSNSPQIVLLVDDDAMTQNHCSGMLGWVESTNGKICVTKGSKGVMGTDEYRNSAEIVVNGVMKCFDDCGVLKVDICVLMDGIRSGCEAQGCDDGTIVEMVERLKVAMSDKGSIIILRKVMEEFNGLNFEGNNEWFKSKSEDSKFRMTYPTIVEL